MAVAEDSDFVSDFSESDSSAGGSPFLTDHNHDHDQEAMDMEELEHEHDNSAIFSNDLVLRNILKFLPFQDLKSLRLLNRLWNLEATKILIRDLTPKQLEIAQINGSNVIQSYRTRNSSTISLNEFSDLIQNSQQFPSRSFVLSSKIQLQREDREIRTFFKDHGNIIKWLKLFSSAITDENRNGIEKILTEQLPNLEILVVVGRMNQILCDPNPSPTARQLKKLKKLILVEESGLIRISRIAQVEDNGENKWFPMDVNLARTFPCLKSLTLLMDTCGVFTTDPCKVFSCPQIPVLTVKTLVIGTSSGHVLAESVTLSTAWLEFLSQTFPNVEGADFGFLEDFKSASEFLWKLESLKYLKFGIYLEHKEEPFPKYDSILTGLSEESVERLYRTPQRELNRMTRDDIKALRVKSSIIDLQNLKHLCILFFERRGRRKLTSSCGVDPGSSEASLKYQVEDNIILSHVAGRFAFRMCQKLGSNIHICLYLPILHYDPQHTFRTLVPFVPPIQVNNFSNNSYPKFLVVDEYLSYKLEET